MHLSYNQEFIALYYYDKNTLISSGNFKGSKEHKAMKQGGLYSNPYISHGHSIKSPQVKL